MATPPDRPPSYEQATGSGSSAASTSGFPSRTCNGIPLRARRSMEDELRALPAGWVREFDPKSQHQFFVDVNTSPPRSIWHHPYDDEQYVSSLPPAERDRIRRQGITGLGRRGPSKDDIAIESTDDEAAAAHAAALADEAGGSDPGVQLSGRRGGHRRFGRKLKDRLTGTTHEERAAERERRTQMERDLYRQHQILRRGMCDAMASGEPQLLGEDDDRNRVYLEPPGHTFPGVSHVKPLSPYMLEVFYEGEDGHSSDGDVRRKSSDKGHGSAGSSEPRYVRPDGGMYGYGYGGYGCGKYGGGRWDAPRASYGRPKGDGYGGGLGFPLVAPMLGGMVLGGLTGLMI
ncbi:hypothetical protein B0T26DRAFT_675741 [Lasiosphaeria miniovina]|uniref:WW domain-containing protein n=1 Tax=Lasiosphaeria miniovina TaxID=1954250 RepID=A0AA40AKC7_9PEZI|nr:uncharacterized protein B0T26DRAFT_675741 [Lasiosphaeria miniovina]KAK0717433.1 hypothetical protein B0T26DRAFT_675741 [Lasiosphaeria miniovina]